MCCADLASSPGRVVSKITLGRQLGLVKIVYGCACHVGKLYVCFTVQFTNMLQHVVKLDGRSPALLKPLH